MLTQEREGWSATLQGQWVGRDRELAGQACWEPSLRSWHARGPPGACAVLVLGGCMTALVFSVKRDVKPPAKRAGE